MFLIILAVFVIFLYLYVKKKGQYWQERNVKYIKSVPVFGSLWKMALGWSSFADIQVEMFNSYPDERYGKLLTYYGRDANEIIIIDKILCNNSAIIHRILSLNRYIGIYGLMQEPVLLLKDPDLIKQITVKDFDAFPQHKTIVDEDADPLWGKHLFSS